MSLNVKKHNFRDSPTRQSWRLPVGTSNHALRCRPLLPDDSKHAKSTHLYLAKHAFKYDTNVSEVEPTHRFCIKLNHVPKRNMPNLAEFTVHNDFPIMWQRFKARSKTSKTKKAFLPPHFNQAQDGSPQRNPPFLAGWQAPTTLASLEEG